MELVLREDGRFALTDVTPEAWAFINGERVKLEDVHDNGYYGWYFSKKNYDGTVYMRGELKNVELKELIDLLSVLEDRFGLTYTPAAEKIVREWKRAAELCESCRSCLEDITGLRGNAKRLTQLIRTGCNYCEHLEVRMEGDDRKGYCQLDGKQKALDDFLVPYLRFGSFTGSMWNTMFLPGDACKYLQKE